MTKVNPIIASAAEPLNSAVSRGAMSMNTQLVPSSTVPTSPNPTLLSLLASGSINLSKFTFGGVTTGMFGGD